MEIDSQTELTTFLGAAFFIYFIIRIDTVGFRFGVVVALCLFSALSAFSCFARAANAFASSIADR